MTQQENNSILLPRKGSSQYDLIPFPEAPKDLKPTTKTENTTLSPRDAAKKYSEDKKRAGWCIDISGNNPVLLHSKSNRVASMDDLKLGFNEWANNNKIRVETASYGAFLTSLPGRVGSSLVRVLGSSFKPATDEPFFTDAYGAKLANTYFAFQPAAPADMTPPAIFLDMLERVFPLEGERTWVLQYAASIINNPLQRPKHGLILSGAGATGKSLIVQLIKLALGGRHVNNTATFEDALGEFAEIYPNNLLVSFEDKVPGRNTYTNIKQIVDCNTTSVQIKGQQRRVERGVYARTIITTNSRRIFKFDYNERRFFAPQYVEHLVSPVESGIFFKKFIAEFFEHPDTPAFLYHWFLAFPMDGFEYGSCPTTPTMERMIELSDSVLTTMLSDYVIDKPIFHTQQVIEYLETKGIYRPNPDDIKIKMNELNYELKRQEIKSNPPIRPWVWKPITITKSRTLTPEETAAIRKAESQSTFS